MNSIHSSIHPFRSVGARLFSILWIMIGIIGFGILTGQLTGEIVKANSPPPPVMKGQDVGVMRFRDHDSLETLQRGGRVVRNTNIQGYQDDVQQLIEKLKRDEIGGFVLDKWVLAYVMLAGEKFLTGEQMEFFINQTTHTEKKSSSEHHSYGILVRDEPTFDFFEEYVLDSQDRWAVISEEWWVSEKKRKFGGYDSDDAALLLSPEQPALWKTFLAIAVMIGVTLFFGLLFELRRKLKREYKKTIPKPIYM